MKQVDTWIAKMAEEKYPITNDSDFNWIRQNAAIEFAKDMKDHLGGFALWFVSDENPYQTEYHSDDDNDGKYYDYFSEGINRHYYTMNQLIEKYFEQLNAKK